MTHTHGTHAPTVFAFFLTPCYSHVLYLLQNAVLGADRGLDLCGLYSMEVQAGVKTVLLTIYIAHVFLPTFLHSFSLFAAVIGETGL